MKGVDGVGGKDVVLEMTEQGKSSGGRDSRTWGANDHAFFWEAMLAFKYCIFCACDIVIPPPSVYGSCLFCIVGVITTSSLQPDERGPGWINGYWGNWIDGRKDLLVH